MHTFRENIRTLKLEEKKLFYNGHGNDEAYKLGVPHISLTLSLNYTIRIHNTLFTKEPFYLVDFENECINLISINTTLTYVELSS